MPVPPGGLAAGPAGRAERAPGIGERGLDTTEVREWAKAQGTEVKSADGCLLS
jgi:hypothetical protein